MHGRLSAQGFNSAALIITFKRFPEAADWRQRCIRTVRPCFCWRRPVLKPQQSRSSFASPEHKYMLEEMQSLVCCSGCAVLLC